MTKIKLPKANESVSYLNNATKNIPNVRISFLGKSRKCLYVLIYDETGYTTSIKGYVFAVVGKYRSITPHIPKQLVLKPG